MANHRVRTGLRVAGGRELIKRVIDPCTLRGPVGNWRLDVIAENVFRVDRVKGELHLVNGHAIGLQLERPSYGFAPLVIIIADHAGDEIDINVRKTSGLDPGPGAVNFMRLVCAAVFAEDLVIEMLDAEA